MKRPYNAVRRIALTVDHRYNLPQLSTHLNDEADPATAVARQPTGAGFIEKVTYLLSLFETL